MKVAAILGEHRAGLVDKEIPKAGGKAVVVKVRVTPMCTEYKDFKAGKAQDCLGHEAVGEVVEVAESARFKVGDRVVAMPLSGCGKCHLCQMGDYIYCRNGADVARVTGNSAGNATYGQYLLKEDWLLLPIPPGLTDEQGAMACCGMGPTFGAMQKMAVDGFDTVLISGAGPVGLGGVVNAVVRGARVLVVEGHPYRAKLARDLGAELVVDPAKPDALQQILSHTQGLGADKAVETSGFGPAKTLLLQALRCRGQAALVGWEGQLDANTILGKGLVIHGAWHWNLNDAARMMQAIDRARPQIDKLITHRFGMSRVQEAMELQCTGNCGKVLLDPWS